MEVLGVDREFTRRYLNEGFSGGEKKRCEILQMAILKPLVAVMDETDSGLDIDALRVVANAVNAMRGPDLGVLIITHYQRILGYIQPDFIHIMLNGRIVEEGGPELATELEQKGYEWVRELHPEERSRPKLEAATAQAGAARGSARTSRSSRARSRGGRSPTSTAPRRPRSRRR